MPEPTIAFVDIESTSLRRDRRAWEIALILRELGHPDREESWFIHADELDLGNADLASLKFGGFYDRHPQYCGGSTGTSVYEEFALSEVEELTRGAIVMGSNPSFDAETLASRMRAHSICPSWHYHLEDVPTMALGWLHGAGKPIPGVRKSDQISVACGVDPTGYDRHTALGDCRWIRDLYDVVTGVKAVQS